MSKKPRWKKATKPNEMCVDIVFIKTWLDPKCTVPLVVNEFGELKFDWTVKPKKKK